MATSTEVSAHGKTGLPLVLLSLASAWAGSLPAQTVEVPEVPIISVSPQGRDSNSVLPDWDDPVKPAPLSGRERQAVLQQVSGGAGGLPLINNIQTQGRTPTLRQVVLTVKRPWYVHRAFLAGEGVQRVDSRSAMHLEGDAKGLATVGLNLIKDTVYLIDFLVRGEGAGEYRIETDDGAQVFPDADGKRTHVLVAVEAKTSGWMGVGLRREGGPFELHTVEVTLARGPNDDAE